MASVQGAVVGAGTVLNPRDLETALDASARFAVSPGLTEPLAKEAITSGIPFLPGVTTSADIMCGLNLGLDRLKFFPAETAGGLKALKALSAVFRSARFCPTGGITAQTARDWLAESVVLCVGGSWLIGSGPLNPSTIEEAAREATRLRKDDLSTDPRASTFGYAMHK